MIRQTVYTCVAAFLLAAAGCTEYGGGAGVVPEVTVLAADASAAEPSGEAAEGSADATAESATGGAGPGTFTGQVKLVGTAPSLSLLVAKGSNVKDAEVCAAVDVADERLVVSPAGGVANVFIWLKSPPKGGTPLPESDEAVIFDQKNCQFLPHAMVVPVKRTVKVLSADAVAHNTHTYPAKNDALNQGVQPNDREGKLSFQYKKPESVPVSVTCDFHAWMKAWHLPVDHPYAAVSDAEGNFTISDLPPGKHTFLVWHESVNGNFIERKLEVTIKPGETTTQEIPLAVDRLKL
ncbi:MAG: hypothetical protein JNL58_06870 [Planctomyces sp.]|nr:hypothetical protein [Planctomyces sp.]